MLILASLKFLAFGGRFNFGSKSVRELSTELATNFKENPHFRSQVIEQNELFQPSLVAALQNENIGTHPACSYTIET